MSGDERDFDILYRDSPVHVRSNANLPGHLVYTLTKLTNHADYLEATREALEEIYPGTDWKQFSLPTGFNPVRELVTPYAQYSRAEAMKGSEQVVRGFQGNKPSEMEGVGGSPNLLPRQNGGGSVVLIQNMAKEAKKSKSIVRGGLGGWR